LCTPHVIQKNRFFRQDAQDKIHTNARNMQNFDCLQQQLFEDNSLNPTPLIADKIHQSQLLLLSSKVTASTLILRILLFF